MRQLGLYFHIPFCKTKCYYCDFNSFENLEHLTHDYVKALRKEMDLWSYKLQDRVVSTVYIGGGTPTILTKNLLLDLLKGLGQFNLEENAEVTIEANPNTLDKDKLKVLKCFGVNRLSIGLQSFDKKELKTLGRTHTLEDFKKGFHLAREVGFKNINVDVIFGIPGQDINSWKNTLNSLIKLSPEHISAYSLKIEKDTPIEKMINKGYIKPVSEDVDRKMYKTALKTLKSSGYVHYEISNFAKPGKESLHNLIYWENKEYIGIGAGAHSYYKRRRFHNLQHPQKYIKTVFSGKNVKANEEKINKSLEMAETVFLGLRLVKGLSKKRFKKRFRRDITEVYGDKIKELKAKGLLKEDTEKIILTDKGLDLANEVFVKFLP